LYQKTKTKKKNKAYQKGYRFELRVKKHFEQKGYYVVRKYASKGAEDLIAMKSITVAIVNRDNDRVKTKPIVVTESFLIQCKNLKVEKKLKREDAERLIKLAKQCGATPLLATNPNHKLTIVEVI
jgi:Holliday junction resolvase